MDYRLQFISQHLYHLLRGVKDGSTCEGYVLWAFTDCVSPMNAALKIAMGWFALSWINNVRDH